MAIALNSDRAGFPCRLCGAGDMAYYYSLGRDDQFKYYRCVSCGLVNYDLSGGLDQSQYIETTNPTDDSAKRNLDKDASWAFVEKWVPGPGRFLDIGCGTGRLPYLAKRSGWDAHGLELSEEAASAAREKAGVPVAVGDFLTAELDTDDAYDLVSLRHVLEHLIDPRLAMTRIGERLRPGGFALFEMPNIEGLDKKLKRLLVDTGLHRRRFPKDFLPGHCNEYSRSSFEFLLKETGFELVRWETYSMKPLANFIYTRFPIGNKARALARKLPTQFDSSS